MGRSAALAAWVLASTLYFVMLGWSLPALTAFANGQPVFDMMPTGYSLTQASAVITALGEDGRAFYSGIQHKLDTAYPPLLGLAFSLSFKLLFSGNVARALVAIAAIAAGLDLLENAAVADMLNTSPSALTKEMVAYASRLTVAKSALTTVLFLALLAGLARILWRRFSNRAPHMA